MLLDKGVVRRLYEFTNRASLNIVATDLQAEAARGFALLSANSRSVYITQQSANVLRRRVPGFAAPILTATHELRKGRYLRRWARRLRDLSFGWEDAIVLAYGSFGIELNAGLALIELVVTTDLKLAGHFNNRQGKIEERFTAMIRNLPGPYSRLRLPVVMTTTDLLKLA